MKYGLLLPGILILAGCSSSNDGTPDPASPIPNASSSIVLDPISTEILFDPISTTGRNLLSSPEAEQALLNAARPAQIRTILSHLIDVTEQLTITHGSPLVTGQSDIGQELRTDIVNCDNGGTVARRVDVIDASSGQSNQSNTYDNCQINGSVINGEASHSLIETADTGISKGIQTTASYQNLTIDWSDGTRNEVTGKFTSNSNQSVAGSGSLEGNDYTETYSLLELKSIEIDGATSALKNLEVRNSFRSYGPPVDQTQSLEMIGFWVHTTAQGEETELTFSIDPPLLSDVNTGSTGTLIVSVSGGESVTIESLGGYEDQVVVNYTDAGGSTTSDLVSWDSKLNLLGSLPKADCHFINLAPICA